MSAPEQSSPPVDVGDGSFKTTHWSVVLAAGRDDSAAANAALAKLCQTYWYPLYTYVRRSGHSPEDAQDLTQEFFARLLRAESLKSVRPAKAKFRSFLLVALNRFLANEWHRANRLKRGGGQQLLSLDAQQTENRYRAEPADNATPEKAFERRWALTLLEQTEARLEREFVKHSKADVFAELRPLLSGDNLLGSYAEISQRLGMSEGALRVSVHRLRQRFRELLRLEIASTVSTPSEVDDEIRFLFVSLA